MSGRVFFDTTILIYAVSKEDARAEIAEGLIASGGSISVQVLNEFVSVARRKLDMSWQEIKEVLGAVRTLCESPVSITVEIHESALRIAQRYRYNIYDAMIIATALSEGCEVLYSEDMQHGHRINDLRIHNPFG